MSADLCDELEFQKWVDRVDWIMVRREADVSSKGPTEWFLTPSGAIVMVQYTANGHVDIATHVETT